ncbi:MAG: hypothetical protein IVZ94_07460 [Nitrospirae bacterium]|nr:hypothetical protein [Nitrospirota bacterium]
MSILTRKTGLRIIKETAVELKYEGVSVKTAIINYRINVAFVIGTAMFLPKIGAGFAINE